MTWYLGIPLYPLKLNLHDADNDKPQLIRTSKWKKDTLLHVGKRHGAQGKVNLEVSEQYSAL